MKFLALVTITPLILTNHVQAAVDYQLSNLGSLGGGSSIAYAINARGEIVGASQTATGPRHAFLYNDGIMVDLGALGIGSSIAYGLNDDGVVVGDSDVGATTHAFIYSNGTMLDITPGAAFSTARAINSSGQVVGDVATANGANAYVFSAGGLVQIAPLPNDSWARAYVINESGEIAGISRNLGDPASPIHAFKASGNIVTTVNGTVQGDTFVNEIDEKGNIVGQSEGTAAVFDTLGAENLGTLGGILSDAYGVDTRGEVVGTSQVGNAQYDAFLYDSGVMIDLNTLIAATSGWVLEQATGINDSGQIVGNGTFNGEAAAFLLTPTNAAVENVISTPEPGTLPLLAFTTGWFLRRRRV
jgi:probable HAF family extracellular repeat protein